MPEVLPNDITCVTTVAIALGDTTVQVNPALGPAASFRIRVGGLGGEIMLVTAGGGTTTLTVTRAQDATTKTAYASGAQVDIIVTATGILNSLVDIITPQTITAAKTFATGAMPILPVANAVNPAASAPGDTVAPGVSTTPALADHKHARESFAAPALTLGTANAAGAAGTLIRSDATILAFDVTVPTTSAVGDAAATGAATVTARRDHVHGREAFAAPNLTLGTSNVAGAATTLIRSDATILAFDATVPTTETVGQAAATGSATVAARRDHLHGREGFATPAVVLGTAAAVGAAGTLIRSDSTIAAFDATVPTTSAVGDAAATGAVALAARRDHTHGREAFGAVVAQVAYGAASANGVATTDSRSDHVHGTVPDRALSNFAAGSNPARTIGTPVTNGTKRRTVHVTVVCTPAAAGTAYGGFTTTVGGTAITITQAVGSAASTAPFALKFNYAFDVDPGASYTITSSVTGAATVTLDNVYETDF